MVCNDLDEENERQARQSGRNKWHKL